MFRRFIAAALLAAFSVPASAIPLATIEFEGPSLTTDTGVSGSFASFTFEDATQTYGGWSGKYAARRDTGAMTLALSGLKSHTTISMSFVLGFLESLDSTNGSAAPDYLTISIDGTQVAQLTANNATGTVENFAGGTILGHYVQANANTFYSDTIVDMSSASFMTFAHTASTLNVTFQAGGAGWQGGSDEGWGIDDIKLTYDAAGASVPEPATLALLGLGLAGIGFARKKKQI
jgi:hypothetical protein